MNNNIILIITSAILFNLCFVTGGGDNVRKVFKKNMNMNGACKGGNIQACKSFTSASAISVCQGPQYTDNSSQVFSYTNIKGDNKCNGDTCHIELAMSASNYHAALTVNPQENVRVLFT
ncbi:hypothetical protein WDU94_011712 [Cyamophila willieti]